MEGAPKMDRELKHASYEESLREWGLLRRLWARPNDGFPVPRRALLRRVFTVAHGRRTRGRQRLKQESCRPDIGKTFLPQGDASSERGSPENCWSFHPWRFSRHVKFKPWAT